MNDGEDGERLFGDGGVASRRYSEKLCIDLNSRRCFFIMPIAATEWAAAELQRVNIYPHTWTLTQGEERSITHFKIAVNNVVFSFQ